MKKLFILLVALLMSGTVENVCAQKVSKEHTKMAKKAAKALEKEGWKVSGGAMPIVSQLAESYAMQEMRNDDGDKKYVFATQKGPGKFYSAAKAQALANAKTEIASKLESEMAGIIENKLANDAIDSEDAESINQTLQNSKQLISAKLGKIITVCEWYRELPNKGVEVEVTIACDFNTVEKQARKVLREELLKKSEALGENIDKILSR